MLHQKPISIWIYSVLGLGEEMLQAGYKDIVNIDISPVVVSHLSEKYKETPGLTCNIHSILFHYNNYFSQDDGCDGT